MSDIDEGDDEKVVLCTKCQKRHPRYATCARPPAALPAPLAGNEEKFAVLQELEKQYRLAALEAEAALKELRLAEEKHYLARNKAKGAAYALKLAREALEKKNDPR